MDVDGGLGVGNTKKLQPTLTKPSKCTNRNTLFGFMCCLALFVAVKMSARRVDRSSQCVVVKWRCVAVDQKGV